MAGIYEGMRSKEHSDRIKKGLAEARRQGKRLGRPKLVIDISKVIELTNSGLGIRKIAKELGCSHGVVRRAQKAARCSPPMSRQRLTRVS